jgi:hypothetical protein
MQYEVKLAQVIGGVVVGAVPFIVGALRDRVGYGLAGMFACVLSTKLAGFWLSVPVCFLFAFLILRAAGSGPPEEDHAESTGSAARSEDSAADARTDPED